MKTLQIFTSLIAIFVFLFASSIVEAKTPEEVITPYKAYRAALKKGNNEEASKQAQAAWEKAESLIGDAQITGDLAINFAEIRPSIKYNNKKQFDKRLKAFSRAIKLAKFHEEDPIGIELSRHIKRIEANLSVVVLRNGKAKEPVDRRYFAAMEKALDQYNYRGSTFEGDMEVLRVRYHELMGNPEKGVEAALKAESIYNAPTEAYSSHYPIVLKLFKGNVLRKADQPIKAALEYQDVMQNLEGTLPADHLFVKTAFKEWVKTRATIVEDGQFKEAEAAGLCKCWPFEEYADDILPLKRVPPRMPAHARRSGHVIVVFDVDENGKPFNVKVVSSTESLFEKPAIKSVKAWEYSPIGHGENEAKVRKGVSSKISFVLRSRSGKLLPEPNE